MPFCQKCGTNVPDNAVFCAACGAQTDAAAAPPPQGAPANNFVGGFSNTADHTASFDPADISANKGLTILSYLGFLVLIPLLAAPQSKFAQFHAKRGLNLFLMELIAGVGIGILTGILVVIFFPLGILFGMLMGLVNLAFLIFIILGIINVVQGQAKELPYIEKYFFIK